jgi:nucleoside-diphosphate-sugar epimerase
MVFNEWCTSWGEPTHADMLATAELLVERWRCSAGGRTSTVLRPAIPMAADCSSSLARALAAGFGQRLVESRPGSQFVHLDDVASAVALGVRERLDGVYNVAPDGWIPGERLLALTGDEFQVPLPDRVAEVVEALRWRFQRGPIPPGLRSYTQFPWAVANDKLKACGWRPTVTNEQVYVEGTEGRWWTTITPKRRQELALGAVGGLVVAAIAAGVSLLAWSRRRTSRSR